MNKALVVQSEWCELFGQGAIKIISQLFRGNKFYNGSNVFEGSNGTCLQSECTPAFGVVKQNTLFVRGSDTNADHNIFTTRSHEFFDKILHTVGEYNEAMDKPKVVMLTQEQKDGIVSYSKGIATRAASIFATFADNKSTNMDGAMKAKVQLMTSLLGCIPMGIETCPFCVVNDNNCDVCEYKNNHGNCLHGISVYNTTSAMIGNLRDYIRTNYWKGI